MDTPKYITFKQTKDGRIYSVKSHDGPTGNPKPGPNFVGIVFTGDGKVMDAVHAEVIEDINPRAIRAWMRAQESWAASGRSKDEPMWDRYIMLKQFDGEIFYKRDR